ncbi:MAG: LamG domain-containing protein [Pseudomonadota bacterium]
MKKLRTKGLTAASLVFASITLAGCSEPATSVKAEGGYSIDVLQLDGTDTLAFEPNAAFEPAEQSTIEFWVKPEWDATPDFDPVVLSNAGANGAAYLVAIQREKDGIALASGDEAEVAEFDFSDGKLHHVALIDLNGSIAVVVDGALVDEFAMTLEAMQTDGLYIGSAYGGDDGFEGVIGGLRLWDVAVPTESLAKYRTKDVFDPDEPHPDLEFLSVISNFAEDDIIVVEPS